MKAIITEGREVAENVHSTLVYQPSAGMSSHGTVRHPLVTTCWQQHFCVTFMRSQLKDNFYFLAKITDFKRIFELPID